MKELTFQLTVTTNVQLSEDDSEVLQYALLDYLRNGVKADMADKQFPFNVESIDLFNSDLGQVSVFLATETD